VGEKGIMIPLMVSETAIFIDSMLKRDNDAFNGIKNGYYLPDDMIDCPGPTNQGPGAYTMIDAGLFDKAIPDKSRSSKQKYRLPEKGEFFDVPVQETVNILIALINGLVRFGRIYPPQED
jgi:hypothetical protein